MPQLFIDRLIEQIQTKNTPCIVGLDPSLAKIPADFLQKQGITDSSSLADCAEAIYQYNLLILEAIADLVPAIKPQCGLLVILDVKRGDIASTAEAYANSYLPAVPTRPFEADAITVVPYLGEDCLTPFFDTAIEWGKGMCASSIMAAMETGRTLGGDPVPEAQARDRAAQA